MALRAYLFDADGEDREVDVVPDLLARLGERRLLWLDVLGRDGGEVRRVADLLGLSEASVADLLNGSERPHLERSAHYFQIDVHVLEAGPDGLRSVSLDFLAGDGYVVTVHAEPVGFLDEYAREVHGTADLGRISAASFLAALLDWHLTTYFRVLELVEGEVDDLDEGILTRPGDDRFLADLARLRRRVGEVRRRLSPHRDVYAALARPDFTPISTSDVRAEFETLDARFQRAFEATENTRELVLGSFDLLMTRTGQRTNDVMKALTVATVVLGSAALVAAVFSMSVETPFGRSPWPFWVALALMCAVVAGLVALARRIRWI